jgi:hypothetical protein
MDASKPRGHTCWQDRTLKDALEMEWDDPDAEPNQSQPEPLAAVEELCNTVFEVPKHNRQQISAELAVKPRSETALKKRPCTDLL